MIGLLARERLLGAALGSVLAGFLVFEERKRIYESISNDRKRVSARFGVDGKSWVTKPSSSWSSLMESESNDPRRMSITKYEIEEPIFGKSSRSGLAHT